MTSVSYCSPTKTSVLNPPKVRLAHNTRLSPRYGKSQIFDVISNLCTSLVRGALRQNVLPHLQIHLNHLCLCNIYKNVFSLVLVLSSYHRIETKILKFKQIHSWSFSFSLCNIIALSCTLM